MPNISESEEITQKRNDFIGHANSVISDFKHVDKMCLQEFLCHTVAICLVLKPEEYYRLQHSLAQGHPEALVSAKYNTDSYRALSCRRTAARGAAVSQNRENVQ